MHNQTLGYEISDLPGQLPPDLVRDDVDLDQVAQIALCAVRKLTADVVTDDIQWKDWMSLTGELRTTHGADAVVARWTRAGAQKHHQDFEIRRTQIARPCKGTSWVAVNMSFVTRQDNGLTGYHSTNVALTPYHETWKVWMIVTILESFDGYGHPDEPRLTLDTQTQINCEGLDYAVAIVGAGQTGLSLAGRLKALSISAVVIDKADIGSAWTSRYDSVRQHTLREYNNLPFGRTWEQDDPDLLPGKIVAEGFTKFASRFNVEVWANTTIVSCTRDDRSRIWTIEVTSGSPNQTQSRTIRTRHLAIAVGAGVSMASMPNIPGSNKFKGCLIHQSGFRNAKSFAKQRGIVVGSGTTGHDIAQDMFDNGMSVTMIQRGKTAIYPMDWIADGQKHLWNINIPTGIADRIGGTGPVKVGCEIIDRNMEEAAKRQEYQNLFAGLQRAGFRVDRDQSMLNQIYTRYGGYYIDVGTCKHIVNGDIKVKSSVPIREVTESGMLFEDGEEIAASLIVFATGYDWDYRKSVAQVVGSDIAKDLPEFWGLTKDGDIRSLTEENRPGLWMVGGTAPQARWISRFTALKMLLSLIGIDNVVE